MPTKRVLRTVCSSLLVCAAMSCTQGDPQPALDLKLTEDEISSGALYGSLVSAGADTPLVLMIPGSGPTDRDGNGPNGLNTNAYKLLAEELFREGISTVRIDKHGMFSSAASGNANAVSVEHYASDYSGWVETLLSDGSRSCVYILGHSEGGVMAIATAIGRNDICGLVLLATPGRPLDQILIEQLEANPANTPILDEALQTIASLKQGEYVDISDLHPALGQLFHADAQGFVMSMMSHDPAELLRRADVRSLVVQGGTDIQVSETDARILASVNGAELLIIPNMNHVLKNSSEARAQNAMTYSNPNLPLSEGLVDAVADFVLNRAS